jgi:hypothetical protein
MGAKSHEGAMTWVLSILFLPAVFQLRAVKLVMDHEGNNEEKSYVVFKMKYHRSMENRMVMSGRGVHSARPTPFYSRLQDRYFKTT